MMIPGTTIITVRFDLNSAVAVSTVLFYRHNNLLNRKNPMRDLAPDLETGGFIKQN